MPTRTVRTGVTAAAACAALWRLVVGRRGSGDFAGQVVLITGGSRGLGLALARRLAAEQARLVVCARDAAGIEAAGKELESLGAEVLAVACDVGDADAVERLAAAARERFGRVDVLVANAGIISVGPLETQTRADFVAAVDTMLWGVINPVLAVLPAMRARRSGTIVVITSIGGKISAPHLLPYNTAKFGAVGFAEGLRAEVAKDGVRVVTVVPGLMRTGSPVNAWFKGQHRAEYGWFTVSDSIPVLSTGVERAVRRILEAAHRGKPEVILTIPAHLAVRLHGLAPALTIRLLSVANRLLPRPVDNGTGRWRGRESESAVTRSPLTALTRRAARDYRQVQ